MENEVKKFESFVTNPIQTLTLDQLKQTHMEDYPDGTPVGGIYHYSLINEILEMLDKENLTVRVPEIFAANNKFRHSPGVSVLPEVEERTGKGSLESHILRRVFCNIHIEGGYAEEGQCYNIAISYTQLGILIGMGPYVYACHNQHICGAQRLISNYSLRGVGKLSSEERKVNTCLNLVQLEIKKLLENRDADITQLGRLRREEMSKREIREFIGMLVEERVRCTNANPLYREYRFPPLNSSDINNVVEFLINGTNFENTTAYDVYQAGTRFMKPDLQPFENICMQSASLFTMLTNYVNER